MNCWWTSEAVVYTKPDFEGHRIRYLIAEKRARIVTRIDGVDDFPETLKDVNPTGIYPILVDKNLICHGSALEELVHERFPAPTLLPIDPIKRAQVRMLANEVRAHYSLPDIDDFLAEVQESYNDCPALFIAGSALSVVDVALAPMLYEAIEARIFKPTGHFAIYVDSLLSRPAFMQSLHSSTPTSPEEELELEVA